MTFLFVFHLYEVADSGASSLLTMSYLGER